MLALVIQQSTSAYNHHHAEGEQSRTENLPQQPNFDEMPINLNPCGASKRPCCQGNRRSDCTQRVSSTLPHGEDDSLAQKTCPAFPVRIEGYVKSRLQQPFAKAMATMRTLSLLVLSFGWCFPLWCQTTSQDYLRSTYQGKTFLLRNFYTGSDLHYDQNGTLIGSASSSSWTLAHVQIKTVTVIPDGGEIAGKRQGWVYKGPWHGFRDIGKIKIHVALPDVQAAKRDDLDSVMNKVFVGTSWRGRVYQRQVTSEEGSSSFCNNPW